MCDLCAVDKIEEMCDLYADVNDSSKFLPVESSLIIKLITFCCLKAAYIDYCIMFLHFCI
jgi:hypothetical protein